MHIIPNLEKYLETMNESEEDAEAEIKHQVDEEIKQLKRKKGSAWKGSSRVSADPSSITVGGDSDAEEEEALERAFILNLTRIKKKQACEKVL